MHVMLLLLYMDGGAGISRYATSTRNHMEQNVTLETQMMVLVPYLEKG